MQPHGFEACSPTLATGMLTCLHLSLDSEGFQGSSSAALDWTSLENGLADGASVNALTLPKPMCGATSDAEMAATAPFARRHRMNRTATDEDP